MDIFIVLGAGYLATGIMLFCRTYFVCVRMIETKEPKNLIIRYRFLHATVFAVGIAILTFPLTKVAFSDEVRKRFCIGYVNAVMEKK